MRLGIMGGTFDPIHSGHVEIAKIAMEEAGLHKVVFLPDGDPPHKDSVTRGEDRLNMVKLAIADFPGFIASDMELKRKGTTYTVDTLLELKNQDEDTDLFYIVGSDTLRLFPTWKSAGQVASLCRMLVAPRPGDNAAETLWFANKLFHDFGLIAAVLSRFGPDISSTDIREAVKAGRSLTGLVPLQVEDYIREKGLYLR
ncbi:MAG: nicotinate-nucleotide adenylyltransferase [Bacillota bacterium]|nr:nicotinate-nucleotide adenylyltransferase [Bacillota bacterium]